MKTSKIVGKNRREINRKKAIFLRSEYMSERIHNKMYGTTQRRDFSKIKDVLPIPYLIEVQKDSYENFIDEGIREVLQDYSPINDFAGRLKLEFLSHSLEGTPKYSVKECKDHSTIINSKQDFLLLLWLDRHRLYF